MDLALDWDASRSFIDFVGQGGDLLTGDDLPTSILISVFTDRVAAVDDVIPDGTQDPRGWALDPNFGSRLWLLAREKQTDQTLRRAYDYIVESIKWLVDVGVVAGFEVSVRWERRGFLGARIVAHEPTGGNRTFAWVWQLLGGGSSSSSPLAFPPPAPAPAPAPTPPPAPGPAPAPAPTPAPAPADPVARTLAATFDSPLASTDGWGTFEKPFSAASPWNGRPVNPMFSSYVIPTDVFSPAVSGGVWSVAFAQASVGDPELVVQKRTDRASINTVYGSEASITIPRWPASAVPAAAMDGHLDIYDPVTGIIHSFFECVSDGGTIRAGQYNSAKIADFGWPPPGRWYEGARAVGCVPVAGLIRAHEIDDGLPEYGHALVVSMAFTGLSGSAPGFVWPAQSADAGYADNSGQVPEGALIMLPATFDAESPRSERLRKVARTLKKFGARVADRNTGTPFVVYVEGVTDTFNLHASYPDYSGAWSSMAAADLNAIRQALRLVTGAEGWLDGNGNAVLNLRPRQRMLSGVGAASSSNVGPGTTGTALTYVHYDVVNDRVLVTAGASGGSNNITEYLPSWVWPKWESGKTYKVAVQTSGVGLQVSVEFMAGDGSSKVESGFLTGGQPMDVTTLPATFDGMATIKVLAAAGFTGWFRVVVI